MWPFSSWKISRKKRAAHERADLDETQKRLMASVSEMERSMGEKPCPFLHPFGSGCTPDCVHFEPGKVFRAEDIAGPYIDAKFPRCRLWEM